MKRAATILTAILVSSCVPSGVTTPIAVVPNTGPPGMQQPPPAPTYYAPPPQQPPASIYYAPPAPEPRPAAMRRPARDSNQPMCHAEFDCEFHESCRDRGDGIKLCMGNGERGDFCANGLDCGEGLFCRESDDGYKRCM